MTATQAQKMTGVEKAMALDVLDADGVDYLTDEDSGIFIPDPMFDDVPAYMYGLPNEG